jgi:hypothetical protein
MPDFETMPVGTREEMEKARKLLREAAEKVNPRRARVYRTCAVNLLLLVEQSGVDHGPR